MSTEPFRKLMRFLNYVLEPAQYDEARTLAKKAFSDAGLAIDAQGSAGFQAFMRYLKTVLTSEDYAEARNLARTAMSDIGIEIAVDAKLVADRAARGVQAYEAAREAVRPYIGDVGYAFDSAGKIYRHALRQLGHDVSGITSEVAGALWPALKGKKPARAHTVAMDAKATDRRAEMFPNGNRLYRGF